MNNPYVKGSLWRRWEPHMHSPGTVKNDKFSGSDLNEKWNKFIDDINKYPDDIAVVAITDYLSIDNYLKFEKAVKDGLVTKKFELILPNIELRITPVTGEGVPINIHCIFNPDFVPKLNDRFYSKLRCHYQTRDYLASRTDLIELGRIYKNNQSLQENDAYKEGIKVFVPSIELLKSIFTNDKELKDNCLIVVSNSSNDGASGLQAHCELIEGEKHNSIDGIRQTIYYLCDGIFSANEKDIKYFLGQGVDNTEEIKRKCRNIMPCLHGCDAHDNSKIFKPDKNRYCWIKADPTFEGLRQIIFEPSSRIRIQEDKPEQKRQHLYIDKVKFVRHPTDKTFSDDFVEINQNLNSIIGGKSSGKSLLLYYIAKTVDPLQVNQKLGEFHTTNHYDFEKNIADFDFEVYWGDGSVNKLSDDSSTKTRQITYLPQMYINYLAERKGNDELKRLIQSILEEKETFSELYNKSREEISRLKGAITNSLFQYFDQKQKLNDLDEQLKTKGDKAARQANLGSRKEELEQLRIDSGFSVEEEADYNRQSSLRQIHLSRLNNLLNLQEVLRDEYRTEIVRTQEGLEKGLDSINERTVTKFIGNRLLSLTYNKLVEKFKTTLLAPYPSLLEKIDSKISQIDRCLEFTRNKIGYYNNLLGPYLEKITKQDKLQEIQSDISQEEATLLQIKEIEQKIALAGKTLDTNKNDIVSNYALMMAEYQKIINEVNSNYSEINKDKEISLKAILTYDSEKLFHNCTKHISKYSTLASLFGNYFNEHVFIFTEDEHLENINDFFNKVLTEDVRYNVGGSRDVVCEKMFDDYFRIDFEIFQKQESIFKMSPGKKGLVLLYLILHLSNATYPILIDQPEDNLDNRTVYKELKDFIKEKKIERQLLIVTHNANLVVPTDSENVIVANQSGQDEGKDNANYLFEYISGSLENTFSDKSALGILNQMGIREHVCDILEGGEDAFKERELRYEIS